LKRKYLLFLDSGIGGLSILGNYVKTNDNADIIYYADIKNFPYGKRDEKEIR